MTSVLAQINLIQVTHNADSLHKRWQTLRDDINSSMRKLYESFRLPTKNTFCIAVEDSKIQRKLLQKMFESLSVPTEQIFILGDSAKEIQGFEDFAVNVISNLNKDAYVLMIVDETLETP